MAGAVAALAPVAAAATVSGQGTDPAGDGPADADIVGVEVRYDTAGSFGVRIRYTNPVPATTSGFLTSMVRLGERQGDGSCRYTVFGVDRVSTATAKPLWAKDLMSEGAVAQRALVDANTLEISASDPALAGMTVTCADALTFNGPDTVVDATPLVDVAAPPEPARLDLAVSGAPAIPLAPGRAVTVRATLRNAGGTAVGGVRLRTTGTGAVAAPAGRAIGTLAPGGRRAVIVRITRRARHGAPVVRFTGTGDGVAAVAVTRRLVLPSPRLALSLSGAAVRNLAPGRSTVVRATIRNIGTAAARNVRLRVTGGGLTVRPSARTLGTLAAGHRTVVSVRVTRRATRGTPAARFTASRTGGGAVSAVRRFTSPAVRTPVTGSLAGRAYVHFDGGTTGLVQPSYRGYFFVDSRWVFRGLPTAGVPTCGAAAAGVTNGDCLLYRYDPRTRRVVVGGATYTLNATRTSLRVGGDAYILKPALAPGSRHAVALRNISVFGLFPNQVVSTTYLTLTASGEFALTGNMMGSVGVDPVTTSWVTDPGQKGTYRILPRDAIELRFADGKVERRLIVVDSTRTDGKSSTPQKDGLILGDRGFSPPAD